MALPKRKARKITVDDVAFDWIESVSELPEGQCRINLVIQAKCEAAKRIHASCKCAMDWSGDREFITTPRAIAQVIRYAMKNGWAPTSAAEDFRLDDFDRVANLEPHSFYSRVDDSNDD